MIVGHAYGIGGTIGTVTYLGSTSDPSETVPHSLGKFQDMRVRPDASQAGNKCCHWKFSWSSIGQMLLDGNLITRSSTFIDGATGEQKYCLRDIANNRIVVGDGMPSVSVDDGHGRTEIFSASGNGYTQVIHLASRQGRPPVWVRYATQTTVQTEEYRTLNNRLQIRIHMTTDIVYYDGREPVHRESMSNWSYFSNSGSRWLAGNSLKFLPGPEPPEAIHHLCEDSMRYTAYYLPEDYAELCNQAVENTRVNHVNMLTTPLELWNTISGKEAVQLAESLLEHARTDYAREAKALTKMAVSAYLNGRFGSRLTGLDLEAMLTDQFGPNREKLHGKARGFLRYNCKNLGFLMDCYSSLTFNYTFSGFNYLLKRWDNARLPTLSDVWDAIPYSFVVDWSLGIGDMLSAYEHNKYLSKMDVSNIWQTCYLTFHHSTFGDAGFCTTEGSGFIRIGQPYVSNQKCGLGTTGHTKNVADLTALTLQATR